MYSLFLTSVDLTSSPYVAEPLDKLSAFSLSPFWGIFGESLALNGEKQKPRPPGPN